MRFPVTFKCPFYAVVFPNREIRSGWPVTCGHCVRKLKPARWHLRLSGLVALALTTELCLFLGFGGLKIIVGTVLSWLPLYVGRDFLFVHIVPARFKNTCPGILTRCHGYSTDPAPLSIRRVDKKSRLSGTRRKRRCALRSRKRKQTSQ